MPAPSPPSPTVVSRLRKWSGGLALSLILPGCASTALSQPVKVVTVGMDCPRLTLSPELLTVRPVTPVPGTADNGAIEDTLEIVAADLARDRGQLKGLTAAERQRAADQSSIDAACRAAVERQKRTLEQIGRESVTARVPFWRRLGL